MDTDLREMPLNTRIAMRLEEMAELLAAQQANPFRVKAYRNAACTLAGLRRGVAEILAHGGRRELESLPGIGRGIANSIAEMLSTGRWAQLERLRGELDPLQRLENVPGLGPVLAARIHQTLGIDTLEALENAAFDGSLAQVPGIGPRRLAALRASLDSILARTRRQPPGPARQGPAIDLLLEVDQIYRARAHAGELPRIAPRRFNPQARAWLPILHLSRAGWHFTALYSNTARAHALDREHDWVVIYFYDDHHQEGQHTVVTETRGDLAGQRVVRGREGECRRFYTG